MRAHHLLSCITVYSSKNHCLSMFFCDIQPSRARCRLCGCLQQRFQQIELLGGLCDIDQRRHVLIHVFLHRHQLLVRCCVRAPMSLRHKYIYNIFFKKVRVDSQQTLNNNDRTKSLRNPCIFVQILISPTGL